MQLILQARLQLMLYTFFQSCDSNKRMTFWDGTTKALGAYRSV